MENMKLNNNLECPMLGLGTFMLSPEDAYTSTLEALKMGYSLIDTANAYVNAFYGAQRSLFCFRTAAFRSQRPPIF